MNTSVGPKANGDAGDAGAAPRVLYRRVPIIVRDRRHSLIKDYTKFLMVLLVIFYIALLIFAKVKGLDEERVILVKHRPCEKSGAPLILQTLEIAGRLEYGLPLEQEPLAANVTVFVKEPSEGQALLSAVARFRALYPDIPFFAAVDKTFNASEMTGRMGKIMEGGAWDKAIEAMDTPYILIAKDLPHLLALTEAKPKAGRGGNAE